MRINNRKHWDEITAFAHIFALSNGIMLQIHCKYVQVALVMIGKSGPLVQENLIDKNIYKVKFLCIFLFEIARMENGPTDVHLIFYTILTIDTIHIPVPTP